MSITNVKFNNKIYFSPGYFKEEECFGSGESFADLVPNLQASSSCTDHSLCGEEEPEQGARPFVPHPNPNLRGDHKALDNVTSLNEAAQSSEQEMKNRSDAGETRCKCTKPETREAGTQTPAHPVAETQDASTQCSFVGDSPSVGRGTDLCHSPVDASAPNPARRGQCCTGLQQDTNAPSMGEAGSSIKSLWRQQKPRHNCVTSTNVRTKSPQNQSDYKSILQRPINPFLNTLSDNKGKRLAFYIEKEFS